MQNGGILKTANTGPLAKVTFIGPSQTPGSWVGIFGVVALSDTTISYATNAVWGSGTLTNVYIDHTAHEGVVATGALTISGGSVAYTGGYFVDGRYRGSGVSCDGCKSLSVTAVTFHDNDREAIWVDTLGLSVPVSLLGNQVSSAGKNGTPAITVSAIAGPVNFNNFNIRNNSIQQSGTGSLPTPAISLIQVYADFGNQIVNNTGAGNGLDAIALLGVWTESNFTWITPTNSAVSHPLGYILGGLTVDGGLTVTIPANAVVKTLPGNGQPLTGGQIVLRGAHLDASAGGATFTSMRDNSVGLTMCPSSLMATLCGSPQVMDSPGITLFQVDSGSNAAPTVKMESAHIRWTQYGINLTAAQAAADPNSFGVSLHNTEIDHVGEGLEVAGANVRMSGGSITNTFDTPYSNYLTQNITALEGHGLHLANYQSAIVDSVTFANVAGSGVTAVSSLPLNQLTVTNNSLDSAGVGTDIGVYGDTVTRIAIVTRDAVTVNVSGNTVTRSGTGPVPSPAIQLRNVPIDLPQNLANNSGGGNGLDAIDLAGITSNTSFTWLTPTNSPLLHPLGYISDGVTVQNHATLTIPANAIVKGSALALYGATLDASAGGAIFTPAWDTSVGIPSCPSFVAVGQDCNNWTSATNNATPGIRARPDQGGYAGGVSVVGASLHAADIDVATGAAASPGAPTYGLNLVGDTFDHGGVIITAATSTNIAGGGISYVGIPAILHYVPQTVIQASGADLNIQGMTLDQVPQWGIQASSEYGHLVNISSNVLHANNVSQITSGILISQADHPVVRNNELDHFPLAIQLSFVTADFSLGVTGNSGMENGLDAIALTASQSVSSLTWITPVAGAGAHALGYVLNSGDFTIGPGLTLTFPRGSILKSYYGRLVMAGAYLDARAGGSTFTSWYDGSIGEPCFSFCTSPAVGDWGGIVFTADGATGAMASGNFSTAQVSYAKSALSISSGATASPGNSSFGLTFDGGALMHNQVGLTQTGGSARVSGATVGGNTSSTGALHTVGGSLLVSCSTVQNNQVGIGVGPTTSVVINDTNLFGNTSRDLINDAPTDARRNWWGQAGGPIPGQVSNPATADTSSPLSAPAACPPPQRAYRHPPYRP